MSVAIGDLDEGRCAGVAAELGRGAIGLELDVRDSDSFASFLAGAEARLGPLDALVNNAGVLTIGRFGEEPPHLTERMLDVNLGGVITGTRLALERFRPRGHGHIVNLASSAGQVAPAGGATYAATKHAVVRFTRAIRAELRGTGVRTTIVMPGVIRTEMISGFAPARAARSVDASAVADAIVDALHDGRAEVFVPRELAVAARLIAGTPPLISDGLKRLMCIDRVMIDADLGARSAYAKRMDSDAKVRA